MLIKNKVFFELYLMQNLGIGKQLNSALDNKLRGEQRRALFRELKINSTGLKQREWKDSAFRLEPKGLESQIP